VPAESRRIPTQKRSRQRVERILESASLLFIEAGYDATTMENIAERAKTSIGSVYQFFPNKRAIFDAMALRYIEQSRQIFEELSRAEEAEKDTTRWWVFLDRAIDAFAAFNRSDSMVRAVWLNWQLAPDFVIAGEALNREFARRVEARLTLYAKNLPATRIPVVATIIVEHISAMMLVSVRQEGNVPGALLEESKVLLRRYLRPYMGTQRKKT
jgi:AcrR family transcriptional regulator